MGLLSGLLVSRTFFAISGVIVILSVRFIYSYLFAILFHLLHAQYLNRILQSERHFIHHGVAEAPVGA